MTDLAGMIITYKADTSDLVSKIKDAKSSMSSVADVAESSGNAVVNAFKKIAGSADLGRAITNVDVAQAKLALIESDVNQARAKLQTLQNAADAGKSVTGLDEARAKLTLLEAKAQDARSNLEQVKNEANDGGPAIAQDFEQASSGVAQFAERVSETRTSFVGHIRGMIGGLVEFGSKLGMTVIGIQGLAQGARSLAESLLGPAESAEQVESSLEVFTGSAQKALAELKALSDFSAHTPFETSAIDQAALKMQGVGVSSQKVIPYILALGDAIDATGRTSSADLDQIVTNFDKIKTTGHLTTDVMNSFADAGVNAWAVLEKQTGKTHDQLAALISAGLYPADKAMNDLTKGIEQNPLYKGQMANDANIFSGSLSTLKSNFDQVLASFGSPILKGLEPIITDISGALASPVFKDFAGSVGKGIVDTFHKMGDVIGDVSSHISVSKDAFSAFKDFSGFIKQNIDFWSGQIFKDLGNALQPLQGLFSGFSGRIDITRKSVADFMAPINNMVSTLGYGLDTAIKQSEPGIKRFADWLKGPVASAVNDAKPGFAKLGDALSGLGKAFERIGSVKLDSLVKIFKDFEPIVEKVVPPTIRFAGVIAGDLADGIKFATPYFEHAENAISKFGAEIADRVAPIVSHWIDDIKKDMAEFNKVWNKVWPSLAPIAGGVWETLKGITKIGWALVSGVIKIGLDILGGDWHKAWDDLKDMTKGIWKGFQQMMHGEMETLKNILFAGGDAIKHALTWPFEQAWNDISGIFNNIKNMISGTPKIATGGGSTSIPGGVASYASGTNYAPGGLSLVGEDGPELINLPRGSQVIPLRGSSDGSSTAYPIRPSLGSSPSSGGGSASSQAIYGDQTIIFELDGYELARVTGNRQARMVRLKTGRRG